MNDGSPTGPYDAAGHYAHTAMDQQLQAELAYEQQQHTMLEQLHSQARHEPYAAN